MIQQLDTFSKKPLRAIRYSGKEFIQDVCPGFQGDEIELSKDAAPDEEETGEDEENYDIYFPRYDSF
jgi:hypothetical protein